MFRTCGHRGCETSTDRAGNDCRLPRISLIHTSCDLVTRTAPGAHPIRRTYVYIRHCRATEASAEVRPPKWGDTCSTHTQQQHFLRFRRQCVGPPISIVVAATMIADTTHDREASVDPVGRDLSYSRRLYPPTPFTLHSLTLIPPRRPRRHPATACRNHF